MDSILLLAAYIVYNPREHNSIGLLISACINGNIVGAIVL